MSDGRFSGKPTIWNDERVLLKAAAALVMLATIPEAVSYLSLAIPRLVVLLREGESLLVKRNVCAALTSIMNASQMLYSSVVEYPGVVEGFTCCLQSGKQLGDETLQINAAAAMSVFSQREDGLTKVLDASAEDELIYILSSTSNGNLLEEAVDAICALASHENTRHILISKGVVTKLASLIANPSSEICVRALLALGMLCGTSSLAQVTLAEAHQAIETLLVLMKSGDTDIQGISRDLFKTLTMNESTRALVEHTLRG